MYEFLPLVSALTALVAVIVGPVVTVYATRVQMRVSVLAGNRQQWINSLRDELSECIGALRGFKFAAKADNPLQEELGPRFEALSSHSAKIKMLLNPEEEDHAGLISILSDMEMTAGAEAADEIADDRVDNLDRWHLDMEDRIIETAQRIFKREWIRVKSLNGRHADGRFCTRPRSGPQLSSLPRLGRPLACTSIWDSRHQAITCRRYRDFRLTGRPIHRRPRPRQRPLLKAVVARIGPALGDRNRCRACQRGSSNAE